MSKIALTPNASGSGTFTIASPNSDTDRVLTLPDEAGTVLTSASSVTKSQIPTYSYAYVQLTSSNPDDTTSPYDYTGGPIRFDQVRIDNNSIYSTSTGQFTIPNDGLYRISVNMLRHNSVNETYYNVLKNGSIIADTASYTNVFGDYLMIPLDTILDLSAGDLITIKLGAGGFNINAASSTQYNSCIIQELP